MVLFSQEVPIGCKIYKPWARIVGGAQRESLCGGQHWWTRCFARGESRGYVRYRMDAIVFVSNVSRCHADPARANQSLSP